MGWKTVMKQQKLVEKMTIEEKAAILSGKTVWQTREIDRFSISCCAAETKENGRLIMGAVEKKFFCFHSPDRCHEAYLRCNAAGSHDLYTNAL